MKKRIEDLESKARKVEDPIQEIREAYQLWTVGKLDQKQVQKRLEPIFNQVPEWRNLPPIDVRKQCYIDWTDFTGYEHKH